MNDRSRRRLSWVVFLAVLALVLVARKSRSQPDPPKLDHERIYARVLFRLMEGTERREGAYRALHFFEAMRDVQGPSVQNARLLHWASMASGDLRRQLLLQWLAHHPDPPSKETMRHHIRVLQTARKKMEILQRIEELDVVYEQLPAEIMRLNREDLIVGERGGKESGGSLFALSEPTRTAFFSLSPEMRKALYDRMPKPLALSELGPQTFMGLWTLLWLFEPDEQLRREHLLPLVYDPGRERRIWVNERDWDWAIQFKLDALAPAQRESRLEEISMIKEAQKKAP